MRRNESVKLLADLKQCAEELTNRIVLAPISGEIIQSSDIQTGSIVSPGQKIAEISPEGELVATCFVKPADIGLIHEKQKVKIQVDAFNYNEWGMLQGDIIDISDDMIIENGSTAYFRIKCKPEKTFLSLKNGYKADIKKGMSLNTRIVGDPTKSVSIYYSIRQINGLIPTPIQRNRKIMSIKVKQRDITDCGAACLASVAAHYNLTLPVARIRQFAGTDKKGTNVLGLVEAAGKMGFLAKGVRGEWDSLFKIPKPAIAHIIVKEVLHHYVVLIKTTDKYIEIMDPG